MITGNILILTDQEQQLVNFYYSNPNTSLAAALAAVGLSEADDAILAVWGGLKMQSPAIEMVTV